MNSFNKDQRSAREAIEYAQWIAFGPVVFQVARSMRNLGILDSLIKGGRKGKTLEEISKDTGISHYGVRVLIEAGLGMGLVLETEGVYTATKTSYLLVNDAMTKVNMDFTHDVNYQGTYYLEDAIRTGKPVGLQVFGDWNTVYEGLSQMPEKAKESWLNFDHLYSDDAFPEVFDHVFKHNPSSILDIGGNTGKISMKFAQFNQDVEITMVDLPGQIEMAKKNIDSHGLLHRINFHATNLLNPSNKLPEGKEAIWMSQFLDCFSDDEIVSILERCHEAVADNGYVYIMEPFWDRQQLEASAFALQQTSLYFTAIANGNSQMYDSRVFFKLVEKAGFEIVDVIDNIGMCQTVLRLKKK